MNTQKLQQHILIPVLLGLTALLVPASALAADLDVVFEQTPLFSNSNIVPGDSVSRTVVVTNNGTETEDVYVSVNNPANSGLANVMELLVTDASPTTYFGNTFLDFFAQTPVALGTLGSGQSRTYTFTASLPSDKGNEYQKTSMGFDLVIGFEGGESTTDCQSNCGGGGGGGGGGSSFILFNEAVSNVDEDGATITWDTNKNATSYLVCGNVANGPFSLNTDPNDLFGYDFEVSEDTTEVEDHAVVLNGLLPGTYECRPASREDTDDDFTVGDAVQFTIPSGNFFGIGGADGFLPLGIVEGISTGTNGSTTPDGEVAGIAASVIDVAKDFILDPTCTLWWLLIFPLLSLIWTVLDDRVRHPNMLFSRFFKVGLIFGGVFTLSVLFAIFMSVSPAWWWVFVLAWILYMIWDYQGHLKTYPLWSSRLRNIFFAAAGLLVILLSTFTSFICFVWPFVLLTAVSVILLFFDGDSGRDR